jgi:hypothetical protein
MAGGRWKPPEIQLKFQIPQQRYGADPVFPTLFAS